MSTGADTPRLRVVHGGEPTAEEVAALVLALAARSGAAAEPATISAWRDREATLRQPLQHGPGAWRASARAFGLRTSGGG